MEIKSGCNNHICTDRFCKLKDTIVMGAFKIISQVYYLLGCKIQSMFCFCLLYDFDFCY